MKYRVEITRCYSINVVDENGERMFRENSYEINKRDAKEEGRELLGNVIWSRIDDSETLEELEQLADLIEECVQVKAITKKQYKYLIEDLECKESEIALKEVSSL